MAATNLAFMPMVVDREKRSNIIQLDVAKKNIEVEADKPKSSKSRTYNGYHNEAGRSSEVYAFRTSEEIKAMIDVFNKHVNEARDKHVRQIASRNKLLFVVGMNLGIRASDLADLKYSFFMNENDNGELEFKEYYSLQPKKTKKKKKMVKLFFNNTVKRAITDYIAEYPFESLDDYVFASREGGAITTKTLWKIIKNAAREAGINQNIGSHSLRKTFGYWVWHESNDKDKALVVLSQIFNHSDVSTTRRYIGITSDEMKDAFYSIDLGMEFL